MRIQWSEADIKAALFEVFAASFEAALKGSDIRAAYERYYAYLKELAYGA